MVTTANAATMAAISSQLAVGVRQPLARSLMTLSEMGSVPPEPRIQITSPLQASRPARVTTNEGSRSRAIRVPCSAPIAVVTSRAAMTAAHQGQLRDPMSSSAVITPPITETKPIDRSMSPEQQREHLAHPQQHEYRALDQQVGQVHRGQEVPVQRLEDDPDHDEAGDHGDGAALAGRQPGGRRPARAS